jgi:hypothetical protein
MSNLMKTKIFSVPFNPKLNPDQYQEFIQFLKEYSHLISDVYFTSRIAPFVQDAMGDVFVIHEDYNYAIDAALNIQKVTGIPVCATFNNIQVPPTQQNLDIFIKNFKPLYDAGVKMATIPHTHWMATGQIKKAFPDLFVKNTILREVHTAQEVVNLAHVGFDYINLDRDLMRNRDVLLEIKKAKAYIAETTGKNIVISLLGNEGCLGGCSMMVEHFEFNNNRKGASPQYFNDPISRVSCPKWDVEDPAVHLKTADFPPWKADWQEFINDLGIDVFKMHGREAISRLYETMEIIRKWDQDAEILVPGFEEYLKDHKLEDKPINIWREKIKNCKFECWDCQYCDKIYKVRSGKEQSDLVRHTADVISKSGIPTINVPIPGLTSVRVQSLLNSLAQGVDSYLEVGTYLGATFCAVLKDNPITATAIDNWKSNIQPQTDKFKLPQTSINEFINNVKKYKGNSIVNVIDGDLFSIDVSTLSNSIKMFFYDGPHDFDSTKRAVEHYFQAFSNETILIFDDANWTEVVEGARAGINSVNALVTYEKLILNEVEDPNGWWNGLYILVIEKV